MAQMHSYLIMNANTELNFLNNEMTPEELNELLDQIALSINNGVDLFDENDLEADLIFEDINEIEETVNLEGIDNCELEITNFIDLSTSLLNRDNDKGSLDSKNEESIM